MMKVAATLSWTLLFALLLALAPAVAEELEPAASQDETVLEPPAEPKVPGAEQEPVPELDLSELFGDRIFNQSDDEIGDCGGSCRCDAIICVGDEECCVGWISVCRSLRDLYCF